MKQKKFAALLGGLLTITCMAQTPLNLAVQAANSYDMAVSVRLDGEQKEISPYIYAVNEFGDGQNVKGITVNAARQGGNRYTGYNWENNYSNAGEDWMHSSDTNIGDITNGTAYAAQKFSKTCNSNNIPFKLTTLQMAGYVANDKAGTVEESETAPSSRWDKVEFRKNGELSLTPDLNDGVVYMDEYVNYLVKTLGDSTTANGMQAYSLDNEPVLWNDTHPRLHPEEVSNQELVTKSIELANVVKEIDPNAQVFGPAFWGILPCVSCGDGENFSDPDWNAVKGNYSWYMDYYLDQMAQAEKEYGKRLLDVVDVHYYAQDCSTDAARVQAARTLYDENYTEDSWIGQWFHQYLPFLPKLQESIDKYYPGTKIAISEYNLGDLSQENSTGKMVSSAIAEADALGCFADNGVYFATYWGSVSKCPYVQSAFNLYTNYDGKGSAFGNTLVEAETADISKAYAYASIQDKDDSTVTMVLSNKSATDSENATITLSGTSKDYKSAVVYAITEDDSAIEILNIDNNVSNNTVKVTLPPMSVAQVVISDKATDVQIEDKPVVTKVTKTYKFDELEESENGFKMVPLGDIHSLKKIVVNTTTSCTSNCGWYGGGGALTFNQLKKEDGDVVWGAVSYSFGAGTGDNEVAWDFSFTDGDSEVITATPLDTYAEWQPCWWKASEVDKTGADVTLTNNSITLVYETVETYPAETTTTGGDKPSETTTTTTVTKPTTPVDKESTKTYTYEELKESENGFKMIPLGDVDHLKKIIINTTASCSSDCGWYGGGGALTFNKLKKADGTTVWGASAYSFGAGTGDAEIEWTGKFTDGDQEEIEATVLDTYAEWQPCWWKSSEVDKTGEDVTLVNNSVTLVYDYDEPSTPEGAVRCGDVNGDGKIDLVDAVVVCRALARTMTLTPTAQVAADCDENGSVDDNDVAILLKFNVMLIDKLPYKE